MRILSHIPLIISHSSYEMLSPFNAVAVAAQTEATKNINKYRLKNMCKRNFIRKTICFYVMVYSSGWHFGNKNVLNKSIWEESVCLKN